MIELVIFLVIIFLLAIWLVLMSSKVQDQEYTIIKLGMAVRRRNEIIEWDMRREPIAAQVYWAAVAATTGPGWPDISQHRRTPMGQSPGPDWAQRGTPQYYHQLEIRMGQAMTNLSVIQGPLKEARIALEDFERNNPPPANLIDEFVPVGLTGITQDRDDEVVDAEIVETHRELPHGRT